LIFVKRDFLLFLQYAGVRKGVSFLSLPLLYLNLSYFICKILSSFLAIIWPVYPLPRSEIIPDSGY